MMQFTNYYYTDVQESPHWINHRKCLLSQLTKEPQAIGAKLRESALEDTITDVPEDIRYSQARELIA